MLGTSIIVFREVLEAALIISIVLAATRMLPASRLWAMLGVAGGLAGAVAVAFGAEWIVAAADGMGQEILNASILLAAAAMLAWHAIWMAGHGRELAKQAKDLGQQVLSGDKSLFAIAVVIGAAVLREGAETVLFLYGLARGSDMTAMDVMSGGLIGLAGGAVAGASLYFGLTRIPARLLFSVTNWMILFLLAGMAAQGTGFLVQAGFVPPIVEPAWDTSWLLSDTSVFGKVMHTLVGYQARPAGIQLLVYVLSFASVALLTRVNTPKFVSVGVKAAAAALAAGFALAAQPTPAMAEFKMRYPNIDYREVEIENNFSATFDKRADHNHNLTFPTEVGIGILPFWFTEIEFEASKVRDEPATFDALTFENYFMLTEPGQYWLDFSIFAEYASARIDGEPDSVKLGLLFQKQSGKFLNTLNLYWEKPVGRDAEPVDTGIYAWQTRYMLDPLFQPGIEIYGEVADLNHPGRFQDQDLRIGPMFAGSYNLGQIGGKGKIKYEAGYLFGLTDATDDGAVRTRLEYEIGF